ncbi:unnamed protein product [Victoria cruziana]
MRLKAAKQRQMMDLECRRMELVESVKAKHVDTVSMHGSTEQSQGGNQGVKKRVPVGVSDRILSTRQGTAVRIFCDVAELRITDEPVPDDLLEKGTCTHCL